MSAQIFFRGENFRACSQLMRSLRGQSETLKTLC